MKKFHKFYIAAALCTCILLAGSIAFYQHTAAYHGSDQASREKCLDQAIHPSKGTNWSIASELKLADYIISGAYGTNNKAVLAVFQPSGKNSYKCMTSLNREKDDILIDHIYIDGTFYMICWFPGAPTEYAEITYTIHGREQEPIKYDTKNFSITASPAPCKNYSAEIIYYDKDGQKYE